MERNNEKFDFAKQRCILKMDQAFDASKRHCFRVFVAAMESAVEPPFKRQRCMDIVQLSCFQVKLCF